MLFSDVQVAVVLDFGCAIHHKIICDPADSVALLEDSVHFQLEYVLAHRESEWEPQKAVPPKWRLERGQLLTLVV